MKKTTWLALVVAVLLGVVGGIGADSGEPLQTPVQPTAEQELEPAAFPGGELEDLFLPEPARMCYQGMCSGDEQCVLWLRNPYAYCHREPGWSCGYCEILY